MIPIKSLLVKSLAPFGLVLLLAGCSAPRTASWDAAATPEGRFAVEAGTGFTLPTQTASSLYGGLESQVQNLVDSEQDSVAVTASDMNDLMEALFAYSLDPMGPRTEAALRYGFADGLDAGYRFASGAHAFDVRWQFLGDLDAKTAVQSQRGWNGSLALQYCGQSYDLPSIAFLDKLQSLLQYEFKRKDLLVPVIFGKPWGKSGDLGSYAFGAAYNHTWIEYGTAISKLVERVDENTVRKFENFQGSASVGGYGVFANTRLGWKRFYLLGAISVFYQNYGSYRLFGGETVELKGWAVTPALGFEIRL
jgi:hypothetical protein